MRVPPGALVSDVTLIVVWNSHMLIWIRMYRIRVRLETFRRRDGLE